MSLVLLETYNRLLMSDWGTEFLPESGMTARVAADKADAVIQLDFIIKH